jgi:DAPG hydrolase PhiG domain
VSGADAPRAARDASGAGDDAALAALLDRPLSPPDPAVLDAISSGPVDAADALPRAAPDRLLDPAPLPVETGWCWLPDGVGYVAVRTEMPGVTGEMVDWWFDWHARDALRYRVWHPRAHRGNRLEAPRSPAAKAHWGAVHHPVEDVGTGMVRARIAFVRPTELGFASDALDDPRVATIVCGFAGDDTRRVRHTPMAHVFLRDGIAASAGEPGGGRAGTEPGGRKPGGGGAGTEPGGRKPSRGDGVVLRSRFWLGAAIRPYGPAPLAALGERVLNTSRARRLTLPRDLPRALATHCAEEYANLAALLPELHARYGPRA